MASAYLLERYEIATAPSASSLTLLFAAACAPRPPYAGRCAQCRRRAAWCAGGGSRRRRDCSTAVCCSKTSSRWPPSKQRAREADLIHLAAHGVSRLDAPLFSYLRFGDGHQTALDCFDLELDCTLVTLSACESGRGCVMAGDEQIGLARAFLYAGARAVVHSLWRIDDRATQILMERFYTELRAGRGPGAALRTAQLQHLHAGAVHPFLWASLTLVGDWREESTDGSKTRLVQANDASTGGIRARSSSSLACRMAPRQLTCVGSSHSDPADSCATIRSACAASSSARLANPTSLAFTFVKLTSASAARDVRDAVEQLNDNRDDLRTGDVEVLGVMPHWHLRAHELTSGGSPGSQPAPVKPAELPGGVPRRVWYAPTLEKLARPSDSAVPVAVLDTRIDLPDVRQRADKLGNDQLRETVEWLTQHSQDGARYADEWREVGQHHPELAANAGELKTYDMADHGLFIAGLIHGAAPGAPIRYEPVLDETGVGDLSLLLLALQRVLAAKNPSDPQIINLSLGFRPHPSRLPQAWYGLPRPGDDVYSPVEELQDRDHDLRWASRHKRQIMDRVDLLRVGLDELGRYLSLNNCLVVAAAGNDSLRAVDHHLPRLDPRLPARFDTVLGVAATLADGQPAALLERWRRPASWAITWRRSAAV